MKHTDLYAALVGNELDFIQDGEINLKSIYQVVSSQYPELCDDSCLCKEICTQGANEPEWKHRVRTVLYQLKKKGKIRNLPERGRGIWFFGEVVNDTPLSLDLPEGTVTTDRKETTTYRVLRDTNLARKIKQIHDNRCQICNEAIIIKSGYAYSEAHHIKPLGGEHKGPDVSENIIVLCPNHHVMCDYGSIMLESSNLINIEGHKISDEFVSYHNEVMCK
ncbi:HNH endonuclease [Candidatus Electrothrix marina]|uniref:HNH endonuclease n=1 Tax=Candidatus Electrothrix marina TaxID=1859130 RepID=A0A444JH83_9BACT|nr:HNH endonuclease [Candidatus Electrothrix marina]